MSKVVNLGVSNIQVTDSLDTTTGITNRGITSDLPKTPEFEGMETLILSLYNQGYNIAAPNFVQSVRLAIQSYE